MLPRVAPPKKTVDWGFGRSTGCLQLCQDPSLSSTPMCEHTHACTGWIHPALSHTRGISFPLLGAVPDRVGTAARAQGSSVPPLHHSKRHLSTHWLACTPTHSMTVRHPQHGYPTGGTHMYPGVHIGFCVHTCVLTRTHVSTCVYHLHLPMHIHMCSHAREFAHTYVHSGIFTPCLCHTHMLRDACTRAHIHRHTWRRADMQGGMSMHPSVHAHTCVCSRAHTCAPLCTCTHTHCTQTARTHTCAHTHLCTQSVRAHTRYVHTHFCVPVCTLLCAHTRTRTFMCTHTNV